VRNAFGVEQQRRPHGRRITEGMKERKNADEYVVPCQAQGLLKRVYVGTDVLLRKHHSLWPTGRPRCENDRHQVVGTDLVQAKTPLQRRNRRQPGGESRGRLVAPRCPFFEILEKHQLGIQMEVESLEKSAARNDMTDFRLRDTGVHHLAGDRVIEIHRHAPIHGQGGVGHDCRYRGRQEHPNVPLVQGQDIPQQEASQDQCPQEQRGAGKVGSHVVGHFWPAHVAAAHPQECPCG